MGRWSNLTYPTLLPPQREYVLGALLGDDSLRVPNCSVEHVASRGLPRHHPTRPRRAALSASSAPGGQGGPGAVSPAKPPEGFSTEQLGTLSLREVSVHAYLRSSRSLAHSDYLMWKHQIMQDHTLAPPRVQSNPRDGRIHWGIRFTTRTTPALTALYRLCYPNRRKAVSPAWLDQLTAFSLAVWYMDDGTCAPGRDCCMPYTGAFPYRQQIMIRTCLRERWGMTGCVIQRNRRQWCLRFTRLGTQQLLSLVEPYIKAEVPSMLYKLGYPERRWTRPIHERMNQWLYVWTPAEDALLQQPCGHVPGKVIAERLNRTVSAVQLRARRLGLNGWHPDRVSDGHGIYLLN